MTEADSKQQVSAAGITVHDRVVETHHSETIAGRETSYTALAGTLILREEDDEKHVHPLQLDVIDRCVELFSNPGETVFTPFMGVGSEVYSAVRLGRLGVGVELKPTYSHQAANNLEAASVDVHDQIELGLSGVESPLEKFEIEGEAA